MLGDILEGAGRTVNVIEEGEPGRRGETEPKQQAKKQREDGTELSRLA